MRYAPTAARSPPEANLITGEKREIALFERGDARPRFVAVLDVSIDVNRAAHLPLLECSVSIHYFDCHGSGEVPTRPGLRAVIDAAPDTCTDLIVGRWLGGTHDPWLVVAAFNDNLAQAERKRARPLALDAARVIESIIYCKSWCNFPGKQANLKVEFSQYWRATHDALTGLANRALYYERLRQNLALAKRHDERLEILNVDMDGLKLNSCSHSLSNSASV